MKIREFFATLIVFLSIHASASYALEKNIQNCTDCNIVLISIDTMRADRIGYNNYFRKITPNLDYLSKDSAVFKNHIAQAPSTAPSHASILTSTIPATHGALIKRKTEIKANIPTLAEILKSNGYITASFNGGGQLDKKFGFSRGFDIYDSYAESDYSKEKMSDKVTKGIDWIEANQGKKYFLFLHTYDIHVPYSPEKSDLEKIYPGYKGQLELPVTSSKLKPINAKKVKLSKQDQEFIEAAYDAEIISVDRDLKALFDYLKNSKQYENTIIIVTSDHGEEFGEHGYMAWHSHTLYDELIKVPLILKLPSKIAVGRSINKQTRSIDIVPTLLELLNIPANNQIEGKSLLRLIENGDLAEFEEFAISQKDRTGNLPTSVRTSEWKLYNKLLFNLTLDPKEQKNAASENKSVADSLKKQFDTARNKDVPAEQKDVEIGNESIEQLKSLGYL